MARSSLFSPKGIKILAEGNALGYWGKAFLKNHFHRFITLNLLKKRFTLLFARYNSA